MSEAPNSPLFLRETEETLQPLVRDSDPIESARAARKITDTVTRDRRLMLRAFKMIAQPITYYEAAERAFMLSSASLRRATPDRLESLRRRGTDLKQLGWIERIPDRKVGRKSLFRLSEEGREKLEADARLFE